MRMGKTTSFYLLLAAAIIQINEAFFSDSDVAIKFDERKKFSAHKYYALAPELWNDRKFAIGVYIFNSDDYVTGYSINLVKWKNNTECFTTLDLARKEREEPENRKNLTTQLPVRRLGSDSVLLTVVNKNEKGEEGVKLVLMNMKNCNHTYIYDAVLPHSHKIFTNDNAADERFTLLVNDKEFCNGHNWCRLFFNPLYQRSEPLDFDFSYDEVVSIKPVNSFDNYLFVVRLGDASGTNTARLYDLSPNKPSLKYNELAMVTPEKNIVYNKHIKNPINYKIVLTNRLYCTFNDQEITSSFSTIHCSKFEEDGRVIFKHSLVYQGSMILQHEQAIPNGFIIFTINRQYFMQPGYENIVEVSVVTKNSQVLKDNISSVLNSTLLKNENEIVQIKHRQYELGCPMLRVEVLKMRMNKDKNAMEMEYLCTTWNYVAYHTLNIVL